MKCDILHEFKNVHTSTAYLTKHKQSKNKYQKTKSEIEASLPDTMKRSITEPNKASLGDARDLKRYINASSEALMVHTGNLWTLVCSRKREASGHTKTCISKNQ